MAVRPRYTATPAKFLLYIRCTPSHITIPPPHIMKSPGTPTQRRRRRAWTIPPPPQEAHTAPRRAPQEAPSAAYALRRTQARSAHRSHSRPQEPPAVHPIPSTAGAQETPPTAAQVDTAPPGCRSRSRSRSRSRRPDAVDAAVLPPIVLPEQVEQVEQVKQVDSATPSPSSRPPSQQKTHSRPPSARRRQYTPIHVILTIEYTTNPLKLYTHRRIIQIYTKT